MGLLYTPYAMFCPIDVPLRMAEKEVEVEMDGDVLWGIPGSTDACSEDSGMVGRLDGTFVGAKSMAGKQV